jgi:RNA polymerase sigma factor (sigma-70 family)
MTAIQVSRTKKRHGRYVVAMVLGTALSALGSSPALAAADSELEGRAVTAISRYCTACWRNARLDPDCWSDCTQDVFCRLLERLEPNAWDRVLKVDGLERREFLRAIDAVKKRTQRGRRLSNNLAEFVADSQEPLVRRRAEDRESVHHAAQELLSPRQQQVLQLSFDGWSVHDIAGKLRLPADRVSDEKYKAIRKLRERLGPCSANPSAGTFGESALS